MLEVNCHAHRLALFVLNESMAQYYRANRVEHVQQYLLNIQSMVEHVYPMSLNKGKQNEYERVATGTDLPCISDHYVDCIHLILRVLAVEYRMLDATPNQHMFIVQSDACNSL
jgi:dimeric dUTPase (all-alpha-NTP-PPase superfamily)